MHLLCLCALLCQAASAGRGDVRQVTRQQLVGAWRLVRIEFVGPEGPVVDPFYQAGSTGMIVYDSTGWMSVHIVAPHRQAWQVPASRLSPDAVSQEVPLKVAAFDTYYAYFGTWDFDAATSVVSHHVTAALIPAETGLTYLQMATFESGRLVLTVRAGKQGEETARRKVWERIADSTGTPGLKP